MKLVEIKDVRVGQIYSYKEYTIIITPTGTFLKMFCDGRAVMNIDIDANFRDDYIKNSKLVGFLNITHKLENNKLIEIPREEFEVDDIIEFNETTNVIIEKDIDDLIDKENYRILRGIDSFVSFLGFSKEYFKKLGILGVTHEFINGRLGGGNG